MTRFKFLISIVAVLTLTTAGFFYYQNKTSTSNDSPVVVDSVETVQKGELSSNQEVFELIGESIDDVSDTGLLNHEEKRFRFDELPANPILLSFIFTRCPNSRMCPLLTQKMASIQRKVRKTDPSTHFVSVTIDPGYDRPDVLKTYAKERKLNLSNWDFVTGDTETVNQVENRLNVSVLREDGNIKTHNMRTYLIDSDHQIRHVFTGSNWSVDSVTEKLKALPTEKEESR